MESADKKPAGAKARGKASIPPDTGVKHLARAIWKEIVLKSKGKVEPAKRKELWKKDQKEYVGIARRVVGQLSRRANVKARGSRKAKTGAKAETGAKS